ncbi:MAG: glycosyltransferase family 4 protein [Chloroflexi bacterium]|nr:glycosyltransferase family 4 protein [Chloroflexota bacterium]
MRILVLSQWYRPEPEAKIHLLARDLVSRGHQVTTITGFPNYPTGELYPGYRVRWRQWEEMDGVRVLRLPLYPDHSRSGIKRMLNYFTFAASASVLGSILSGPADVMWVYHPPLTTGIPAWWIGLARRIPFVYEVQDMWPETLSATGMMPSSRIATMLGWLAKFIYHQAAAVTVISPGFKRNLIEKGVPAERIHVIPNWADEDIYRPLPPDSELGAVYGLNGRFNVMFAGNMGAAQGLDSVWAAAERLRDLPKMQFILIGGGVDVQRLRTAAESRRLENVRFIEHQPIEMMPRFFALADVLLVHLKRDPLFEITIPSKTIAYLACGRPILCAVAGDAADVTRGAGSGVVCPPENPESLVQAIRELYTMSPEHRSQLGQAGRQAYLSSYTRAVLVDCYETLLKDVTGHGRRN